MKMMIASDIHGSLYWCEALLERFAAERAERLVLLGDLLYHGPRNALPRDYNPAGVAELLNRHKTSIFCVRGNCDSEVDQMVLDFPLMADYMLLPVGERMIFATHGHVHNEQNLPPFKKGDVLLHGHTHVPSLSYKGDYFYINPGSVSIPKEGSQNSCITLSDGTLTLLSICGDALGAIEL